MKTQPIRDLEKIEMIKSYLYEKNRIRDRFLFVVGINIGRRMGDIIKLKVRDLRNRDHVIIIEEKTGKPIRLKINAKLKKEIKLYCFGKENNDFLFISRQKNIDGKIKHIGYDRAYQILKDIFNRFNIYESATHTCRKTFGYWFYKRTKDLEKLRIIFNHSSQSITRIYIGIEEDEKDRSMDEFGGL